MSKAARRSKTVGNGHREHRTKKNRTPYYKIKRLIRIKKIKRWHKAIQQRAE